MKIIKQISPLLDRSFVILCTVAIAVMFVIAALPLARGSIYFFTDTARDFLILDEMDHGKIPLIGPRASAIPGVFHGPLWAYLNFPVYKIANGNPLIVGWYWWLISLVFVVASWFAIKKHLGAIPAWVFVLLSTIFISGQIRTLYNPHGAFFALPFFLIFLVDYLKTQKRRSLIFALFFVGLVIQFQMAIGGPILVLTVPLILINIYKTKRWSDLLLTFTLVIPLSTFILFDLRHDFFQLRTVFDYLGRQTNGDAQTPYLDRINQRLYTIVDGGLGIFREQFQSFNLIAFGLLAFFVGGLIHSEKSKLPKILVYAVYFYLGYFFVSVFFNGILLVHHWFPVVIFAYITVAALAETRFKNYIMSLCAIAAVFGILTNLSIIRSHLSWIGIHEDEWVFQKSIADKIFHDAPKEFGYFVFAPDIYAYESKAAMAYGEHAYLQKHAHRLQKKPVTYLIIAPPPKDQPYFNDIFWKQNRVNITREPNAVFQLPAEYRIERYDLTEAEIATPSDSALDWMLFR